MSDCQDQTTPATPQQNTDATQLFCLIFGPKDCINYRPVETWTEAGKKKSLPYYKGILHLGRDPFISSLPHLDEEAKSHRLNQFFGVCPRFRVRHGFDKAWQIRTVRCLWADVDGCAPDEALERIKKSGLPHPSAIVSSGNGGHFYWAMTSPVLIDDVGEPPPVQQEWRLIPKLGYKRPVEFFLDHNGDKVWLQNPETKQPLSHNIPDLSPKALEIQDTLQGIASVIGGDHTHDLARLLRIPGTLNRKDQRGGSPPKECKLIECGGVRYSFSDFEKFAKVSPGAKKRELVAKVVLPRPRKITSGKEEKLGDLINRCIAAETGTRSEVDFALCCFAIEKGIDKADVWSHVHDVGKFEERGEEYFNRTWGKAENHARLQCFEKSQKANEKKSQQEAARVSVHDAGGDSEGQNPNPHDQRFIDIFPNIPTAQVMAQITDRLIETNSIYMREKAPIFVDGDQYDTIDSAESLAGLMSHTAEVRIWPDDADPQPRFEPLPSKYASTWLNNRVQIRRLPEMTLFTRNPVYTLDWQLVKPGYNPDSGIYYAGPDIKPIEGTEHLDRLLKGFLFKEVADRTNFIAMMLTAVLINRFIGNKPGVIFNGNQPELGKTTLAQILAIIRDGRHVETCSYNPNDEEFEKNLGAKVRAGATTLIIDNAKCTGRKAVTIESACLERSITDPIISFRLLGASSSIRAENSHIFAITVNSAKVSPDISSRCVPINLYYEGSPTRIDFPMEDPEGYAEEHREEILSELLGMVERWRRTGMLTSQARNRFKKKGWPKIIGGILEANGEPDFLGNLESSQEAFDEMRFEFAQFMQVFARQDFMPTKYGWRSSDLVALAEEEGFFRKLLNEKNETRKSMAMGHIVTKYLNEPFEIHTEKSPGLCNGTLQNTKPQSPDIASIHKETQGNNSFYRLKINGKHPF